MYIRRTQNQKKKAGGYYYTYRLVESQRTGKKVHQRTLLNLGTDFSLEKGQWAILTKRITEILAGQWPLFDIDCKIGKLAQNYAAWILERQQDGNSQDKAYCYIIRQYGGEHANIQ